VLSSFGALLLAAAANDIRRSIIPNRLCLAIAMIYPVYVLSSPVSIDWIGALGTAGASLAAGLVIFARGWAGGGDVKLFSATALWAGFPLFTTFVLVTALTGSVIALAMLMHRRLARRPTLAWADGAVMKSRESAGSAPSKLRPSQSLPYGAAIAAGGLMTALMLFSER
jgi:prepilin peptidase CpaA